MIIVREHLLFVCFFLIMSKSIRNVEHFHHYFEKNISTCRQREFDNCEQSDFSMPENLSIVSHVNDFSDQQRIATWMNRLTNWYCFNERDVWIATCWNVNVTNRKKKLIIRNDQNVFSKFFCAKFWLIECEIKFWDFHKSIANSIDVTNDQNQNHIVWNKCFSKFVYCWKLYFRPSTLMQSDSIEFYLWTKYRSQTCLWTKKNNEIKIKILFRQWHRIAIFWQDL